MEELYVYALLYIVGFEYWDEYSNKLNDLFLKDFENEELLNLEEVGNSKSAILHILSLMDSAKINEKAFGTLLMDKIMEIYKQIELSLFARRMYDLWGYLPELLAYDEPYKTLSYADDALSWGDEKQCRELYEKAMKFYNN